MSINFLDSGPSAKINTAGVLSCNRFSIVGLFERFLSQHFSSQVHYLVKYITNKKRKERRDCG